MSPARPGEPGGSDPAEQIPNVKYIFKMVAVLVAGFIPK
jgi:hypothetical protein